MRHRIRSSVSVVPLTLALGAVAPRAFSQTPAAGTMKQDAATSGSSAVATEGFDAVKKVEASNDATEAKVQAGALLATGNARSLSATGVGNFRMRRGPNEFGASAAANYARGAAATGTVQTTTVENYQGKLRYDRFLTEAVAVFLSFSGRRDRFQGLDLRLNLDPGVAYYFVDAPDTGLWAELGYDFQYDVRRDANIRAAFAKGEIVDKTELRHSARTFLGFRHKLNTSVSFSTGLEFLLGLPETDYWRLNWDVGLTAAIAERFSLATTFSLKHDNHPLPDVKRTDTLTALSLVYTLL